MCESPPHWNTLYILDTHDCEERILLEEKGETRNKVETLEVLLGLINYGCIKYTLKKKKLNSNWQNEPGRQKKKRDKTYGHIAKSQTFSSPEGLKCLIRWKWNNTSLFSNFHIRDSHSFWLPHCFNPICLIFNFKLIPLA